jgi:hypothetical protein
MFANKLSNYQTIIMLFGIMLLSSCRQSTILQGRGDANDPTPTTASISPTPKSPIETAPLTIAPIASPSTSNTSNPKPRKQDRLNQQALAAVDRQAYDTAISLFDRALANSDSECHKKYNRAWIKAAQKAKSWKATTISSYTLHGLKTTNQAIAKDQKEVFDETFENNLKGYKCDF